MVPFPLQVCKEVSASSRITNGLNRRTLAIHAITDEQNELEIYKHYLYDRMRWKRMLTLRKEDEALAVEVGSGDRSGGSQSDPTDGRRGSKGQSLQAVATGAVGEEGRGSKAVVRKESIFDIEFSLTPDQVLRRVAEDALNHWAPSPTSRLIQVHAQC